MKWKNYLTPKEATLIALKMDEYATWEQAVYQMDEETKKEAQSLCDALTQEAHLAKSPNYYLCGQLELADTELTQFDHVTIGDPLIIRASLADWFGDKDQLERAKLFDLNFNTDTNSEQEAVKDSELSNLREAIGLMASLLAEKVPKYKKGENPNCSQISQDVDELARKYFDLEINEWTGHSQLDRIISRALKEVKEKSQESS